MKRKFFLMALILAAGGQAVSRPNLMHSTIGCFDARYPSDPTPVIIIGWLHYDSTTGIPWNMRNVSFPNDSSRYSFLPRRVGTENTLHQMMKITNNRSPYKDNYETYLLTDLLRLVLTKNVTPDGLVVGDVDKRGQGTDAVLVIDQRLHELWSGGDLYLRLSCRHLAAPAQD